MKSWMVAVLMPLVAAAAGAGALAVWLWASQTGALPERLPTDDKPLFQKPAGESSGEAGTLTTGPGKPSLDTASWSQFRGNDRSAVAPPEEKILREWPPTGPKPLWRVPVGEGYAGAAVRGGRVYLIDYDAAKQADAIRCLSLADGSEIWRYSYPVKIKRYHGMSRTVPAVNDDYVVALGPLGNVTCLKAQTGELVWKMNLVREYQTTVPSWYAGQCPLIDGKAVILAPGGKPLMMAVELATGKVLWSTPNPGGYGMTHSSVAIIDYRGSREYVYCSTSGVVGVDAKDGRILWTKPDWFIKLANIPTPLVIGDDRILFTGGYNAGSVMVRLTGDPSAPKVENVFKIDSKVFASDQQTPVLYRDHVYGVIPGGQLACMDLNGKQLWTSGAAVRFGLGSFILADGLLLVLSDQDGVLHLIEADPTAFKELAKAKVLKGHEPWGPMALAGGRLIVRELTEMVCLEVGAPTK